MSSAVEAASQLNDRAASRVERERQLQRLVIVYILAGLVFMLLPGTFLGVWNLLSISANHTVDTLSPAWLQAHGHAQIFGWLGTFILGIGFYSLAKMGNLPPFAVARGWMAFAWWAAGVSLRWISNVTGFEWRWLLPFSAALELAAFLIFFRTVSNHRAEPASGAPPKKEPWMMVVLASTLGFLVTLVANFASTIYLAIEGTSPALPLIIDQRLLGLPIWGFLVPTVWGFNARWLPIFLGLRTPRTTQLYAAVLAAWLAVFAMLFGAAEAASGLFAVSAIFACIGMGIFEPSPRPAKLNGVHRSFPFFVRAAYVWLLIAAFLSVAAAFADRYGGIWGASRHAVTVGFLAMMVFSIGPKILPAFGGMRVLFSSTLMLVSLVLLNAGCLLRVCSEPAAYEGYARHAWSVLPVSAVIELTAVTVFALNLAVTFLRPPAHLMARPMAAKSA